MQPLGVTRSGSLYYGAQAGFMDVYTATLDPAKGKVLAPPEPINPRLVGSNSSPAWSPDGRYLAYLSPDRSSLRARDNSRMVSIRTVESGETRELALKLDSINQPSWSPDGRSLLAIGSESKNRNDILRIDVQTGAITAIPKTGIFVRQAMWARDGKSVFYSGGGMDTSAIFVRNLETGREKELYRTRSIDRSLALSPDGQQLAFSAQDGGTQSWVLKALPVAGGEPRELLRIKDPERITTIAWMPDGRHLLFGKGDEMWRIPVAGGEPQRLGLAMDRLRGLSVHPDGRRIAFTSGAPEIEVWVMENLLPAPQTAKAPAPRR
jgi:Tol biopolymer transport system component